MIEHEGLDRLRRNFHTGDIPLPTGECLDPELVAALAEGSLDAEARARALRHVAGCALCRHAVASVAAALSDGPITREIEIVEGVRRPRRLLRITLPLAAAAAVLVLLSSPLGLRLDRGDNRATNAIHRSFGAGGLPEPVAPIGTVAAAQFFEWTRVAGADQYRVTLFDVSGTVVYESLVADTTLALPDSVRLDADRPYLWKVQARTGWDRWSGSELVRFAIARDPPE